MVHEAPSGPWKREKIRVHNKIETEVIVTELPETTLKKLLAHDRFAQFDTFGKLHFPSTDAQTIIEQDDAETKASKMTRTLTPSLQHSKDDATS